MDIFCFNIHDVLAALLIRIHAYRLLLILCFTRHYGRGSHAANAQSEKQPGRHVALAAPLSAHGAHHRPELQMGSRVNTWQFRGCDLLSLGDAVDEIMTSPAFALTREAEVLEAHLFE